MLEMDIVCTVTGLVPLFKLIDICKKECFLAEGGGGSTFWALQQGAFLISTPNQLFCVAVFTLF